MSNKPSSRALAALEVLKAGGSVEYRLVRNNYTHREQFEWRLYDGKSRICVKGFGHATASELINSGLLKRTGYDTSISTEYKLSE